MEEIFLRFPHLAIRIFENLSYDTLKNCIRVSKSFNSFINLETKLWTNLLAKTFNKYDRLSSTSRDWKVILRNIKKQDIISFSKHILAKNKYWNCHTPFKILVKYKKNFDKDHVIELLKNFSRAIIHFKNTYKNSSDPNIKKSLINALEVSKNLRDVTKHRKVQVCSI